MQMLCSIDILIPSVCPCLSWIHSSTIHKRCQTYNTCPKHLHMIVASIKPYKGICSHVRNTNTPELQWHNKLAPAMQGSRQLPRLLHNALHAHSCMRLLPLSGVPADNIKHLHDMVVLLLIQLRTTKSSRKRKQQHKQQRASYLHQQISLRPLHLHKSCPPASRYQACPKVGSLACPSQVTTPLLAM